MADFASNVPVSRPVDLQNILPDLDFNGVMWSNRFGFMFQASDDMAPIRPPASTTTEPE